MKSTIIHLTIAAMALLGTVPQAAARSHHSSRIYISGHTSCGAPIYVERYFIGYDRCGNEIWGKRVIRREYRPRYVAPCPPPPCHRGYATGFTIQGSFGR
jgi:hypothetical protein